MSDHSYDIFLQRGRCLLSCSDEEDKGKNKDKDKDKDKEMTPHQALKLSEQT